MNKTTKKNITATTAHRISMELIIGKIPTKFDVCHKCGNRRCVNPKHLYIETPFENKIEMNNRKNGRGNDNIYPNVFEDSIIEQIRNNAIAIKTRHSLRASHKYIENIPLDVLCVIHDVMNSNENHTKEKPLEIAVEIMTCGHEKRYIASTGEGTHFCVMCAFLAEHRINEKIRKVLAE